MPGTVLLEGGNEFSARCREMDALLTDGLDGPVVVTALAGEIGADYRKATANGVRHFSELTDQPVVGAADIRTDEAEALEALRSARLLVLPGGSPGRLLAALLDTPIRRVITDLLAADGRVMGSSAGAMALGPYCVLPGRPVGVTEGLGVVPFVTVPHWEGDRPPWLRAIGKHVPPAVPVLGVPEESGVLLRNGIMTAVGVRGSRLVRQEQDLALGRSEPVPA
jgi:cyanophycinase-like exopeptidase